MKKAISVLLCLCLALSVFTVVPFAASAAEVTEETVGATSGTTGSCRWSLDDEGNLTIAIENKQEHKNEDKHHHYLRREFSYSNYEQNYVLPDDVVKDQISAKVEDGILTVTMPKTEPKQKVTKAIEARHCVEVEAEDKVGTTHRRCCTTLAIAHIYHHIATTRHEVEVVGELIGKNTCYLVTMTLQHLCPCKRRAYGIAIGICMREDNHALWLLDVITKLFYLTSCYLHNRYSYMLISQIYKK